MQNHAALISSDFAGGADGCEIVGVDLIELVDIDAHHCIPHVLLELLNSVHSGRINGWLGRAAHRPAPIPPAH